MTVDFDLLAIARFLRELEVFDSGFAFVIEVGSSNRRRMVAHPDPSVVIDRDRPPGRQRSAGRPVEQRPPGRQRSAGRPVEQRPPGRQRSAGRPVDIDDRGMPVIADAETVSDPVIRAFMARLPSSREGLLGAPLTHLAFDAGGVDYVATYRALDSEHGLDWIIGTVAPRPSSPSASTGTICRCSEWA